MRRSAPRRVENGIKARSKRGAIGEQWWSRRFVEVLESFGMSGRLARGRNYARRGQVMEFELTTGKVRARVQGSRPAPYQARIGVLPLTTAQWRSVTAALGAQALFRAKLLAGEMPHEIEEVFAACGTPLFPGPRATWRCPAPARTGACRASTWPRSATYWPRSSTTTRSRCWPGAAVAGRNCSARCGASRPRRDPVPVG